ncbi:hypothetical protein [Parvularcula maris]|uniref:Uncharacterized protein n=1 Tax=Parvularcula maris TaxID=2965077 RepID=A0A9X2L9D9_9PROT|nr:hypothetical protein [Parvularcula maris]MCQ8185457.1 hypothetical protein [Parvularcula maris]
MEAITTVFRRLPVLAWMGVLQLLLVPVFAVLGLIDERTVDGLSTWLKPVKFGISLGVFLLSLAFFTHWLREGATRRLWYRLTIAGLVLATAYESIWLWQASARGVRSHFNIDSGAEAAAFNLAGLFAIILVLGAFSIGLGVHRASREPGRNRALSASIAYGLMLTFPLTLLTAGLIGYSGGAWGGSVQGPQPGLFGWRVEGGDLRAAHFFATHALQALPLTGLLALALPKTLGLWLVRLAALGYAGFVAWLAHGAVTGQDLPPVLVWPF